MDIKKAIQIEKEYLAYRMEGKEPYHLLDKIKECGFADLSEYFNAKKDYNFEQLDFTVIETTPVKAIAEVLTAIAKKKATVLLADTTFTLVWNGNDSIFNQEYCETNNIPVLPIQTAGGTIVSTAGDLNIGICIPGDIGVETEFLLDKLAVILQKYTKKTVIVDGNDILIDGRKVLGSSTYKTKDMFVLITPVSMTDKTDLITNICTKKSTKKPGYIDFIDSGMLREEVLTWLKK